MPEASGCWSSGTFGKIIFFTVGQLRNLRSVPFDFSHVTPKVARPNRSGHDFPRIHCSGVHFAENIFFGRKRGFHIDSAIWNQVHSRKQISEIDAIFPKLRNRNIFPRNFPTEALSDRKENNPNNAIHRMATRVTPHA